MILTIVLEARFSNWFDYVINVKGSDNTKSFTKNIQITALIDIQRFYMPKFR